MTRPHIEFIHTDNMPWSKKNLNKFLNGIKYKTLSVDILTNEMSLILKYPKGWKINNRSSLTVDEEIYVLTGSININNQELNEGCYAYIPANYTRELFFSSIGAEVLTFFQAKYLIQILKKYIKKNLIKKFLFMKRVGIKTIKVLIVQK